MCRIRKAHKDVNSSISKYGKAIDKSFESSVTKLTSSPLPEGPDLDFALVDSMLRLGRWSLAKDFIESSNAVVRLCVCVCVRACVCVCVYVRV